jgi:hypothetical protein
VKDATEPRIGMKADDLLKMRGRGKEYTKAAPQWVKESQAAVWHYEDCSVVLVHDGKCYRVKAVVRGDGDGD